MVSWLNKYIRTLDNNDKDDTLIRTLDEVSELYLVEKERADEIEKRWNELKERMEREQKEAFSKGYIDYDAFSYVLEVMHDLEEDDNDA